MIEKKDKKVELGTRKIRRGATATNKVKRIKEIPLYRTMGNVLLATNNAVYRFPNPFGAKQVTFMGNAVRYTSSAYSAVDIRVNIIGIAQLAPSYYFTPQTTTSVGLAGPKQKIIQSGQWFLVSDSSSPKARTRSSETVLTNVDWPNATTIVARMEVVDYGPDYFDVLVNLGNLWEISGNFVCV